jgi:hypothetical protein
MTLGQTTPEGTDSAFGNAGRWSTGTDVMKERSAALA